MLQNAAIVFLLPYLGILWKSQGFTASQIGVLSAVRPFICSVSGGCAAAAAALLLQLCPAVMASHLGACRVGCVYL